MIFWGIARSSNLASELLDTMTKSSPSSSSPSPLPSSVAGPPWNPTVLGPNRLEEVGPCSSREV